MVQKRDDMRELIAEVAGPMGHNDYRGNWLDRAADRTGITRRMIRSIWRGTVKDQNHYAIQLLRLAAGRKAAIDLAANLETIAANLIAGDEDFYRPHIVGLIDTARTLRGLDRT